MKSLDNKLKDWLDLANVVQAIRTLRGKEQLQALNLYMNKSIIYMETYNEKFNPLKKPVDYDSKQGGAK